VHSPHDPRTLANGLVLRPADSTIDETADEIVSEDAGMPCSLDRYGGIRRRAGDGCSSQSVLSARMDTMWRTNAMRARTYGPLPARRTNASKSESGSTNRFISAAIVAMARNTAATPPRA
jgi:hypothetical protein